MPFTDPTVNFGWHLPDNGADENTWGDASGADPEEGLDVIFAAIDAATKVVEDDADAARTNVTALTTRISALESGQFLPVIAQITMAGGFPTIPTATPTALDFTTSLVTDTVGMFDFAQPTRLTVQDGSDGPLGSNGRFTLAGLYNLRAAIEVPTKYGNDDSRQWVLEIRKNGTTPVAVRRWPGTNDDFSDASGNLTLAVEVMDEAAVGDYYEVLLTTDQAGTVVSAVFETYRLPSPRFAVSRLIYSAGLDVHGNDPADFDRYGEANTGLVSWAATGGKFGGGRLRFGASGTTAIRHVVLDTPAKGGRAAFYLNHNLGLGSNGECLIFTSTAGVQFYLDANTNDTLTVRDKDGMSLGSTAITSSYHHVECAWTLGNGTGIFRLWLDGELKLDLTGLTLGQGGFDWDGIGMDGVQGTFGGSGSYDIDDLVIQSSLGQRLGDGHRIWTVLPDADAGTNEWNPQPPVNHWALVDDTDPDQDGSSLAVNTTGLREEFTFTLPAITGTIHEISVKALGRAINTPGFDALLKVGIRINGAESMSDGLTIPSALSPEWLEANHSLAGAPSGGVLTTADLAGAVLIIETGNGNSLNVTQVWLEILTVI